MEVVAPPPAHGGKVEKVADATALGALRELLEKDFAATYGRRPQYKQLDWLERSCLALRRSYHAEGDCFTRSVPQLVRAMGMPYDGTVTGARQRYRKQLFNSLRYLADMGWVESRETLMQSSGVGRGWAIRLTPRGCSSVG